MYAVIVADLQLDKKGMQC